MRSCQPAGSRPRVDATNATRSSTDVLDTVTNSYPSAVCSSTSDDDACCHRASLPQLAFRSLAGLDEASGHLGGYGPVISDIARQVAESSRFEEWRFVVTDSERRSLQAGVTRRRPTAAARRLIESMYPMCVFPGCRVPASRCDLDHTTPWGQSHCTSVHGLAPLCRRHHILRHRAGWRYRRSDSGDHTWVSPLGHRYVDKGRSP